MKYVRFFWVLVLLSPVVSGQSTKALGTDKKFEIILRGSDNFISNATTNSKGLTSNTSGKKNLGILIGFSAFRLRRIKFDVQTGMMYRDYGFKENKSAIPYFCIPLNATLRYKLFWRVSALIYGGGELARCHQSRYYYPSGNSTNYNLYLHKNDAVLYSYGGGIGLNFKRFGIDILSDYNFQFDSYDRQYGKTLGSKSLGLELRYQLF